MRSGQRLASKIHSNFNLRNHLPIFLQSSLFLSKTSCMGKKYIALYFLQIWYRTSQVINYRCLYSNSVQLAQALEDVMKRIGCKLIKFQPLNLRPFPTNFDGLHIISKQIFE